jgi:predicted Zn-dependent protease
LIFGHKDNGPQRFDQLVSLLANGMPSEAAVAQVYGSIAALETPYQLYVGQGVFQYSSLPTQADVIERNLPTRTLSVPEHTFARASFHAAMDRPIEARTLVAAVRKAEPSSPVVDDIEGMLLDREQQPDLAAEAFARATAAGSTSYWSYYRLANLRGRTGIHAPAAAAIAPLLERATALEPAFAPAFSMLASVELVRGQLEPALAAARRAVSIDAGDLQQHLLLVRVLMRANQTDEALKVAQAAAPLVRTPADRVAFDTLMTALQTGAR